MVLHFLMVTGRLFHKVAAAFLKHLLPYVTPRVVSTVKNASDSDCRDLVGWYGMTSSSKYWGAVPWRVLKVYTKILYCNLYNRKPMQGFKTGVIYSLLWVRVTNLAEEFCTFCSSVISVCQCFASIQCDVLRDMNLVITGFGYCIYLPLHGQGCIKIYS